jgi:hypothetical protein
MPAADASAIRRFLAARGLTIAMKTGTIDDGTGTGAMESEMLMFTIGRYDSSQGFVPGRSISGFISIRSAKKVEGAEMVKGELARRLIPVLARYLTP